MLKVAMFIFLSVPLTACVASQTTGKYIETERLYIDEEHNFSNYVLDGYVVLPVEQVPDPVGRVARSLHEDHCISIYNKEKESIIIYELNLQQSANLNNSTIKLFSQLSLGNDVGETVENILGEELKKEGVKLSQLTFHKKNNFYLVGGRLSVQMFEAFFALGYASYSSPSTSNLNKNSYLMMLAPFSQRKAAEIDLDKFVNNVEINLLEN